MVRQDLVFLWKTFQELHHSTPPEEIGCKFLQLESQLDPETMAKINGHCPEYGEVDIDLTNEANTLAGECFKWACCAELVRKEFVVFKHRESKFVVLITESTGYRLVTGMGEYHRDVANSHQALISPNEKMWVIGGGKVQMDNERKTVLINDWSGDFGPFDHLLVEKLARKAMEDEGLVAQGWTLKVVPSAFPLPFTPRQ